MNRTMMLAAACAVFVAGSVFAADEAGAGQSNWEKFKEGAKQAGSAAWEGTKNAARKTGDFVEETYDESKAYVQQKMEEHRAAEAAEAAKAEALPESDISVPVETLPEE